MLGKHGVRGADLCKYYARAPDSGGKPGDAFLEPDEYVEVLTYYPEVSPSEPDKFVSKITQTDYRESETQTDPWDPPYIVKKVHKDPELLSIKHLTYGQGLPACIHEVRLISEKRKLELEEAAIGKVDTEETYQSYKHVIQEQVKSKWNYKISVRNEILNSKLACLEYKIRQDFQKQGDRKESRLKTMWMHRMEEMNKRNLKLEKKLCRDLFLLESKSKKLNIKYGVEEKNIPEKDIGAIKKRRHQEEDFENMLSNYLEDPSGLSTVRSWLEKKTEDMNMKIPLIRKIHQTAREKIAEKAYQNILDKRRIKMPPIVYHEEIEQKHSPIQVPKVENVFDIITFKEKTVDNVAILQRALRGFAFQKQMLEMIERYEKGISAILPE